MKPVNKTAAIEALFHIVAPSDCLPEPMSRVRRRACGAALGCVAVVFLMLVTACTSRFPASTTKAAPAGKPEKLNRRPVSKTIEITQVVDAAIEQTEYTRSYDPSYEKIAYPGGDVPRERGVCADVIVRAFRSAGIDLQKEVHEDMAKNFKAYPNRWGARRTDTNIDHRRVANLMTFFQRKGKSLEIISERSGYLPGDVVAWELDNKLLHIGLVTDAFEGANPNYLMVHNIGAGARLEDVLLNWKIIGHYRMWK
jgi:uncharacterized protein YijF (DUF1287 family)